MTVAELIEELKDYHPDDELVIAFPNTMDHRCHKFLYVGWVEISEGKKVVSLNAETAEMEEDI